MLDEWHTTADGRAALITLCDGMGQGHPYVQGNPAASQLIDDMQQLTMEILQSKELLRYSKAWQVELLMPFMHSERQDHQQLAIAEYLRLDAEPWLTITRDHFAVLEQFGRFPYLHDDDMTSEEQAWMKSDEIPLYLRLQGHVDSKYHLIARNNN